VVLREERLRYWLGVGAQPSDRVARFLDSAGITQNATRWRGTGKRAEAIAAQKAQAAAAAPAAGGAPAEPAAREAATAAGEATAGAEAEAAAAVEAPAVVEAAEATSVEQATDEGERAKPAGDAN
jgi:small subunit ribosomal protein S16